MKLSKRIEFRLTAEQYKELQQRAEDDCQTVTDYIKQRIFERSDQAQEMKRQRDLLTEIRDLVGGAEDIYRQLNQDSVQLLRRTAVMAKMTTEIFQHTTSITPLDTGMDLKRFAEAASREHPDRPDRYLAARQQQAAAEERAQKLAQWRAEQQQREERQREEQGGQNDATVNRWKEKYK